MQIMSDVWRDAIRKRGAKVWRLEKLWNRIGGALPSPKISKNKAKPVQKYLRKGSNKSRDRSS